MLHRILTIGLLAGVAAGATLTAFHLVWTVPLILDAEVYEHLKGELPAEGLAAAKIALAAAHGDGSMSRNLLTLVANLLFGAGAGFVFAGLFNLLRLNGPKLGVIWGAAAFVAFSLAPSLGLPPELPGTAAAELGLRQAWFSATVAATAAAIALLAYNRSAPAIFAALVIAAMPHVIGAPKPAVHESVVPDALAIEFVAASLLSLAMFWLVLGAAIGILSRRFAIGR